MQIDDWTNLKPMTLLRHADLPFIYSLIQKDHMSRWIAVECRGKNTPLRSKVLRYSPKGWKVLPS